jgi:uncharacterized protein YjiS (DUF1127 family)
MSDLVTRGPVPLVAPRLRPGVADRPLGAMLTAPLAIVALWTERHRQRRALADLAERNDHLLADIGRTREEAWREAARPFWAPAIGVFLMRGKPLERLWTFRRHDGE